MWRYPAVYADKHQYYPNVWIENDTKCLRLCLDGVWLVSSDFEYWELDTDRLGTNPDSDKLARFEFNAQGAVQYLQLYWQMPFQGYDIDNNIKNIIIYFCCIKSASYAIAQYPDFRCVSLGKIADFERLFLQIKSVLGLHLRACVGCRWSDYSVYGNSFFYNLLCFQHIRHLYPEIPAELKAEYLDSYKDYYMEYVMNEYEQMVQESHLCPHFVRRQAGDGYRG